MHLASLGSVNVHKLSPHKGGEKNPICALHSYAIIHVKSFLMLKQLFKVAARRPWIHLGLVLCDEEH